MADVPKEISMARNGCDREVGGGKGGVGGGGLGRGGGTCGDLVDTLSRRLIATALFPSTLPHILQVCAGLWPAPVQPADASIPTGSLRVPARQCTACCHLQRDQGTVLQLLKCSNAQAYTRQLPTAMSLLRARS